MDGKFVLVLAAASVIFAENIPQPHIDRSTKGHSDRQNLEQTNHFSSDCSSPSCRSHSAKIGLENKLQKARRILRLLEKSRSSNTLVERLPEAHQLKTVPLKDFSSQESSKDAVILSEQTSPESSDESPEKWFIPIDPRPYKSPDASPETWFRPIVPKPFNPTDKSSRDIEPNNVSIPSELSVDLIQEPQPDTKEAQTLGEESNLENEVIEPITLLALKIFNSLPKPRSKEDELSKKEERKRPDNRSELRDKEKVGFLLSGDPVPESKVAFPKSKEEQKADKENMNNTEFERDVHLRESISVVDGSVNVDFGDRLSGPPSETVGSSNRDTGEKIRFRPKKNYLSQLLRHTQELGLVQRLGNIFTLFPERKEGIGGRGSQSGEPSISPPTWIKRRPTEKETSSYLLKKTPETSVLLQEPKEASLLPRQPPMQIQGQPVNYMH